MYYVVYGFLYVLSLLPLRILYLLSDFFYFIVYHVAGYRKEVVMHNLAIAFPEKTATERKTIAKKFYRNFTDFFVETIKLFSASSSFLNKRFVSDYSAFHKIKEQGKRCQVHLGHNFNWELGNLAAVPHIPFRTLGVYMPLSNKTFDRIFRKLRAKGGAHLLPATDMRNAMLPFRSESYALLLVADQSPPSPQSGIWVDFFGKPTAFVRGPENGARSGDLPVIFCYITKIKRGYYKGYFELAEENPAVLPKGELTKKYARFLEEKMREQPENWLWSHRRWKWDWKEEYGEVYQ
ncbi:MAG: lysophospholipid acyltransferase family protein [Flavisolibacter sp.]